MTTALDLGPQLLDDTRFPETNLWVPSHVELRGDQLHWAWRSDAGVASPDGMLSRFVAIRDGRGVVAFARRYGVLGICKHGLPATHNTPAMPGALGREGLGCMPLLSAGAAGDPQDYTFWEPLAIWLSTVWAANAILHLATASYTGRMAEPFAVSLAYGLAAKEAADPQVVHFHQTRPREMLAALVNWWLYIGGTSVALDWTGSVPSIRLSGARLPFVPATFGVLAGQLMLAVARAHALLICSYCASPYLREKRYQPRRWKGRNYCPKCHTEGVPGRLRQRRKRAKG